MPGGSRACEQGSGPQRRGQMRNVLEGEWTAVEPEAPVVMEVGLATDPIFDLLVPFPSFCQLIATLFQLHGQVQLFSESLKIGSSLRT